MSSGSWPRHAGRTWRPGLHPRRVRGLHLIAVMVALGLLAWGTWTWYRGSSFVRIRRVTVIGLSGPDVAQIRSALTTAALGMTTLKVQVGRLEQAVAGYPYVESITVASHGAHAITIDVAEQVPVALLEAGGQAQVVDANDQILGQDTVPHGLLPELKLGLAPTETTVSNPNTRAEIAVLAAAPYPLLDHIRTASWNSSNGVVVQLRSGPELYFGPTAQLAQKWQDAVAVLQNSSSAGAAYIDLTDPGRPAAGVSVSTAQAQTLGLETGASTAPQSSTTATTAGTGESGSTASATASGTAESTATAQP